MSTGILTLSNEGAILAEKLSGAIPDCRIYIHEGVDDAYQGRRFTSIAKLTDEIFHKHRGLIYIAPCGIVVRALASCLKHKTTDPAVVVTDVFGRWAVSLLSGHEGGANDLAVRVGNVLNAEPVVSTTTEARKFLIIGIGCRRGVSSEAIVSAIRKSLEDERLELGNVRLLSSVDIKSQEPGLIAAAQELDIPLKFISSQDILNTIYQFQHSSFVEEKVNLPAVSEPCALLAGRRTRLIAPKTIHDGVTIAIARESSLWSE